MHMLGPVAEDRLLVQTSNASTLVCFHFNHFKTCFCLPIHKTQGFGTPLVLEKNTGRHLSHVPKQKDAAGVYFSCLLFFAQEI